MPAKGSIIQLNLNITKNDVDEDGRTAEFPESWRLMRANDEAIRDPSLPSRRTESSRKLQQVDSFRIAA